ncbi:hypothetical protein BDF14DRAFT_1867832, partial [Spinellus fusiger]
VGLWNTNDLRAITVHNVLSHCPPLLSFSLQKHGFSLLLVFSLTGSSFICIVLLWSPLPSPNKYTFSLKVGLLCSNFNPKILHELFNMISML